MKKFVAAITLLSAIVVSALGTQAPTIAELPSVHAPATLAELPSVHAPATLA